ncbi:hypothetical protein [Thiocystis violacea]|uniref:hypothetical protein n=1 Tax=Thiocystis violacea TaxID=13725 RepID=UPI0019075FFB|nr:hypothetical protein [Thiocystis violacea]MBK1717687.1 hypothetical protein [Thiocystis violacea]
MLDFPVSLALFDFLPVLLMGVALWYLARLVQAIEAPLHRLAWLGGLLIVAGGLSKATWKLLVAATGVDIGWLATALFPLMAPGFALLAVAIWGSARRIRGRRPLAGWRLALLMVTLAFAVAAIRHWLLDIPRGWFLPLLVLVSLGNLVTSIQLIGLAFHLRRRSIAMLFMVNLAMILALQPIAMSLPDTLAMHWFEQSLTSLGTGCFALAAYLLWRRPTDASGRPSTLARDPA